MAVLTDQQRAEVTATFMQQAKGPLSILKMDVRAAVDALDAWYDANAGAINQAIPQPARGALTLTDKAMLNNMVVDARYVRDVAPAPGSA